MKFLRMRKALGLAFFVLTGIACAECFYLYLKVWGPSIYNTYDENGTVASLGSQCIFCKIILQKTECVYEDDDVFVFNDAYPKSHQHILIVPKRHIKSLYTLKAQDKNLLMKMKSIAIKISEDYGMKDTKIGFHHPIFNSIQHLHLHVIGMPFYNKYKAAIIYNNFTFVDIDSSFNYTI
ncbi:hypothetical protein SteCoe_13697 [Stentor coeruleus]|uniref:HIT domain-containing protein n=1 Tax=Stentor coeruleus TaxID=5963 RepID=A0A1R2C7P6_9CILI|nr:hypothetical protein SteCoe_13697 [Stentor coeruleus]